MLYDKVKESERVSLLKDKYFWPHNSAQDAFATKVPIAFAVASGGSNFFWVTEPVGPLAMQR